MDVGKAGFGGGIGQKSMDIVFPIKPSVGISPAG